VLVLIATSLKKLALALCEVVGEEATPPAVWTVLISCNLIATPGLPDGTVSAFSPTAM
jgi:hypothetical protein